MGATLSGLAGDEAQRGAVGGSFAAALAVGLGIFNAVVLVVILRVLRKQNPARLHPARPAVRA